MLSKFEVRYTPPDRTTFARNYIPTMYEHEKVKVSIIRYAVIRNNHRWMDIKV